MVWTVTAEDPQVVIAGRNLAIVVEQELGIVLVALVERAANSSDPWLTVVNIDPMWSAAGMQNGEGGLTGWVNRMIDSVNGYIAKLVSKPAETNGPPMDVPSLQAWLRGHLNFIATANGAELKQR